MLPHPTRTQRVSKNVHDAAHEIVVQLTRHPLKVPAGQDDHLAGVRLQPLSYLSEGVLGAGRATSRVTSRLVGHIIGLVMGLVTGHVTTK